MTILRFSGSMDRLAERHARFTQLYMHVEPVAQPVRQHFQMQLALGGKNRLVKFAVHLVNECWVFFMQGRQSDSHLVLFTGGLYLQSCVNGWLRIRDLRQSYWPAR